MAHTAGEYSHGNLERYEAQHPKATHEITYITNGFGQILALCYTCDVFQGLNEIEAGLPIVLKGGETDESS